MRIVRTLLTLSLGAMSGLSAHSAEPADQRELAQKIVGIWMAHPDEYGTLLRSGLRTFRADKTFSERGDFGTGTRHIDAQIEGRWSIDGKNLRQEVTKSNLPEIVPVGRVFKATVLGITDEAMWVRDYEDGKEHLLTRFKK